jgi:hypothetical protein
VPTDGACAAEWAFVDDKNAARVIAFGAGAIVTFVTAGGEQRDGCEEKEEEVSGFHFLM